MWWPTSACPSSCNLQLQQGWLLLQLVLLCVRPILDGGLAAAGLAAHCVHGARSTWQFWWSG
jgi:hypothetical protein